MIMYTEIRSQLEISSLHNDTFLGLLTESIYLLSSGPCVYLPHSIILVSIRFNLKVNKKDK